ncbi:hypothetical protein C0995_006405, partial [Termitomyces sp. Mi166
MSTPNPLASPALSATSNMSSFIMLSNNRLPSSSTPRSDDSDDEIIYSVSESSLLSADESSNSPVTSDNDFVILSRPRSQRSILETQISTPIHGDDARADTVGITDLTTGLANLSVTQSGIGRRRSKANTVAVTGAVAKKNKKSKKSQPSPVNAVTSSCRPSSARPKCAAASISCLATEKQAVVKPRPKKNKKEKPTGFGGRSIVDDVSDKFSDYGESDVGSPSMYEEAFGFITSFLSNPIARGDSACRLTLLQALIIELGLATSSLPSSLTAAKAYLKSRAFLNINEYIAVRDQGPAAVQRIMHPSRNALIKDLRKNKKKKASLGWVKDRKLEGVFRKNAVVNVPSRMTANEFKPRHQAPNTFSTDWRFDKGCWEPEGAGATDVFDSDTVELGLAELDATELEELEELELRMEEEDVLLFDDEVVGSGFQVVVGSGVDVVVVSGFHVVAEEEEEEEEAEEEEER